MTWPIPSNMANITFLSWWPSKYMAYIHIHQDTAFEELDHYGDKWNIYTHSWSDVFLTKQKKHGPGRPNTQSPVIKLIVVNKNHNKRKANHDWQLIKWISISSALHPAELEPLEIYENWDLGDWRKRSRIARAIALHQNVSLQNICFVLYSYCVGPQRHLLNCF